MGFFTEFFHPADVLTPDEVDFLQDLYGDASGVSTNIALDSQLPVAASTTVSGIVELTTAAEVTAADSTRAVTGRSLADSDYGKRFPQIAVTDPLGNALTTGDGKAYMPIVAEFNGWNLVKVYAYVTTVSSSGIITIMLRRVRSGSSVDMLSTALTIDASEKSSSTAATAVVINTSNDDLLTDDEIQIDIDGAGTGVKGLVVTPVIQLP